MRRTGKVSRDGREVAENNRSREFKTGDTLTLLVDMDARPRELTFLVNGRIVATVDQLAEAVVPAVCFGSRSTVITIIGSAADGAAQSQLLANRSLQVPGDVVYVKGPEVRGTSSWEPPSANKASKEGCGPGMEVQGELARWGGHFKVSQADLESKEEEEAGSAEDQDKQSQDLNTRGLPLSPPLSRESSLTLTHEALEQSKQSTKDVLLPPVPDKEWELLRGWEKLRNGQHYKEFRIVSLPVGSHLRVGVVGLENQGSESGSSSSRYKSMCGEGAWSWSSDGSMSMDTVKSKSSTRFSEGDTVGMLLQLGSDDKTVATSNLAGTLVTMENVRVGARVVRGRDWDMQGYGNRDGGAGRDGTVVGFVRLQDGASEGHTTCVPGCCDVNWDYGDQQSTHRIGLEGRHTIAFAVSQQLGNDEFGGFGDSLAVELLRQVPGLSHCVDFFPKEMKLEEAQRLQAPELAKLGMSEVDVEKLTFHIRKVGKSGSISFFKNGRIVGTCEGADVPSEGISPAVSFGGPGTVSLIPDPLPSNDVPALLQTLEPGTSECGVSTPEVIPPCTFSLTGRSYRSQTYFRCRTCGLTGGEGVCEPCSRTCHRGHDLSPPIHGNFFCDCGAGSSRKVCGNLKGQPSGGSATGSAGANALQARIAQSLKLYPGGISGTDPLACKPCSIPSSRPNSGKGSPIGSLSRLAGERAEKASVKTDSGGSESRLQGNDAGQAAILGNVANELDVLQAQLASVNASIEAGDALLEDKGGGGNQDKAAGDRKPEPTSSGASSSSRLGSRRPSVIDTGLGKKEELEPSPWGYRFTVTPLGLTSEGKESLAVGSGKEEFDAFRKLAEGDWSIEEDTALVRMLNDYAEDRNIGLMTVPMRDVCPNSGILSVANLLHKPSAAIKARFILLRMLNASLERHLIPVVDLSKPPGLLKKRLQREVTSLNATQSQ